ncbi:MAG TPA: phosphate ABC transporter permease subunit PstC [Kofleriaceae bacterium]|jgi:phosphate transport system permease protein|nr:phosphate ABC transporter permease subunit PstC [Kofleriaceae bacterium]
MMQLSELQGRRHYADRAFRGLALGAAGLVLLVLGMIAVKMTQRAWPAFNAGFFTSSRWSAPEGVFGALPFVWGTLYTAAIAIVLAVPVSLGVALFITQVAPPWLKKPMVSLLDLLAVVPSVVFGLWGVLVVSQHAGLGRSFLTAGVILAIMIIPIITSLAREVIETTPASDKEAALALGATRWEMIRASVLPHSKGGLVGAVMLGLGRAMGETIASALVIGSALGQLTLDPWAPGNSMPAVIANEWGEADEPHKAALIALAVTLFVITIAVNLIATAIVQRSMKRSHGT